MNTSIIAIVLAVLLGASIIVFLITLYNRLVMLRFNIDKAYKNIDVLLKQRADEIPNLVTIAKEFASHEKKFLLYQNSILPYRPIVILQHYKRGYHNSKISLPTAESSSMIV